MVLESPWSPGCAGPYLLFPGESHLPLLTECLGLKVCHYTGLFFFFFLTWSYYVSLAELELAV